MSGSEAVARVSPLVVGATLAAAPPHTTRRVILADPRTRRALDEALCTVMRAPRSYTGEDVVELSCHGSPALLREIMERLLENGVRLAEPGEFTRRAFLNGRIDLARAEAVALLIGARTERAVRLAARSLTGGLAGPVSAIREAVLDLVASLEVTLDFPDDVMAEPASLRQGLGELVVMTRRLLASVRCGEVVHGGLTVAIVGPPNAGKSSLFNALVGRERAIVSPHPGTTRDVVEATVVIAGIPVRLLDTAGLGEPRDDLDAEGMRRAVDSLDESDMVLVVLDGSGLPDRVALSSTAGRDRLIVLAKSDLGVHPASADLTGSVRASVKTAGGTDALVARLAGWVEERGGASSDESALVASLRQRGALEALAAALDGAAAGIGERPLEVVLVDLRDALRHASGILGTEIGDDVLDRIFSTFCVGK